MSALDASYDWTALDIPGALTFSLLEPLEYPPGLGEGTVLLRASMSTSVQWGWESLPLGAVLDLRKNQMGTPGE